MKINEKNVFYYLISIHDINFYMFKTKKNIYFYVNRIINMIVVMYK